MEILDQLNHHQLIKKDSAPLGANIIFVLSSYVSFVCENIEQCIQMRETSDSESATAIDGVYICILVFKVINKQQQCDSTLYICKYICVYIGLYARVV